MPNIVLPEEYSLIFSLAKLDSDFCKFLNSKYPEATNKISGFSIDRYIHEIHRIDLENGKRMFFNKKFVQQRIKFIEHNNKFDAVASKKKLTNEEAIELSKKFYDLYIRNTLGIDVVLSETDTPPNKHFIEFLLWKGVSKEVIEKKAEEILKDSTRKGVKKSFSDIESIFDSLKDYSTMDDYDGMFFKVSELVNKGQDSNPLPLELQNEALLRKMIIEIKKGRVFQDKTVLEVNTTISKIYYKPKNHYLLDSPVTWVQTINDLYWKYKILSELLKNDFLKKETFRIDKKGQKVSIEEEYESLRSIRFYFANKENYKFSIEDECLKTIEECYNFIDNKLRGCNRFKENKINAEIQALIEETFERCYTRFTKLYFPELVKVVGRKENIQNEIFDNFLRNLTRNIGVAELKDLPSSELKAWFSFSKNMDRAFCNIPESIYFREALKKRTMDSNTLPILFKEQVIEIIFTKDIKHNILYIMFKSLLKEFVLSNPNFETLGISETDTFLSILKKISSTDESLNGAIKQTISALQKHKDFYFQESIDVYKFKLSCFIKSNFGGDEYYREKELYTEIDSLILQELKALSQYESERHRRDNPSFLSVTANYFQGLFTKNNNPSSTRNDLPPSYEEAVSQGATNNQHRQSLIQSRASYTPMSRF